MSDLQSVERLLARLIADAGFRARFDRDPAGTARELGLDRLAAELADDGGRPLQPLDARESRSSLAGALAAAALEGLGLFEHAGHLFGAEDAYASSGNGAGPGWDPDQFGAQGTGGPELPESDALLHNPNVTFDQAGVTDLLEGRIDPRVVSLLTELSAKHQLVISSTTSDHSQLTAGGSVSNHFYGRAFDISSVDGQPVTPSNDAAKALALELSQLDPSIRPTEIGSPWSLSGAAYFTDGDHQNHLHVAWDDPISPDWQPAATDSPAAAAPAAVPVAASAQSVAQDAAPEEDDSAGDDLRADGTVDTSGDDDAEDDSDNQDAAPEDDSAGDDLRADGTVDTSGDDDAEDDSDDQDAGSGDESDEDENESDDDSDEPGEGSNGEDANDDTPEPPAADPGTPAAEAPAPDPAAAEPPGGDELADAGTYPGDGATPEQLAAWMAAEAERRGLPAELPVMAALTESGLKNLDYGDADSVGFFQMRTSVWDGGQYAGYSGRPALQLQWFLDQAEAVKAQRVAAGLPLDSAHYGDWIADVERPAEEFRGRYQPQLDDAQALLGQPAAPATSEAAGTNDAQILQVPTDGTP